MTEEIEQLLKNLSSDAARDKARRLHEFRAVVTITRSGESRPHSP